MTVLIVLIDAAMILSVSAFAPVGQSTQLIVGATSEMDKDMPFCINT